MKLPEFFERLDQYEERIPLDDLTELMRQLEVCCDDVSEAVVFKEECYCRNVLRVGAPYSALVLCWKDGQASPVHDHIGSSCGVRVLKGRGTERSFEPDDDGRMQQVGVTTFREGDVCASFDKKTHEICNEAGDGSVLVTLHVYSPPLKNYHTFCLETGQVKTRVDEQSLAARREAGLPCD
ncbi:MAG: cysteine dioxygenase family protein [Planctomycetes bacterium]|nr:cysteine dioxygenase family protein [Planctomycetota bacterium]